jgi:hypothetical protein
MRLPLVIIFAIVAFNISMFTLMLQMDMLIFHSPIAKAVFWLLTAGAWVLAYIYRAKSIKLF